MKTSRFIFLLILVLTGAAGPATHAATYFVDSVAGLDSNSGLSTQAAWRTLDRAGRVKPGPGDAILLKRGSTFAGSLRLHGQGSEEHPITISCYGEGPLPVIDAVGYKAGIQVFNSRHLLVENLEITGDGGPMADGSPGKERAGVLVNSWNDQPVSHVTIRNLHLHDIYPGTASPHEGRYGTTHLGYGVVIRGNGMGTSRDFLVEGCRIERVGFKGVELKNVGQVMILNNHMEDIGGPAIQPGEVEDLVVRGNIVDGPGSSVDPRMHGRGSGIWPWTSRRVLIERNTFMKARGKADSCGIHIDFNCRDVVVQYNLSIDNEGGFIEILGNNHNCAYRYNISINDGARVKGQNDAEQEGKILWTSGYVGRGKKKTGPFNSYIYNNTIYVGPGSRNCFSVTGTTDGLLVANNIFHILGETLNVLGDQDWRKDEVVDWIARAEVRNNVVIRPDLLPESLPVKSRDQVVGDVQFSHPGGYQPADYIPRNADLVRDRGIQVARLADDPVGLWLGLQVETDFLGNPIAGLPDIGAIEVSGAAP